jgi:Uma2 family endonuclease
MTTFWDVESRTEVRVPSWVSDLESFRRWSDSDEFPEFGHVSYFDGEVHVDMSKEQLFSHNDVKSEFTAVLRPLVRTGRLGRYWSDGAFVTNTDADVSNAPDGVFVSADGLRTDRVHLVEGRKEGYVELEGTPDMVLEVVSDGSVRKDTVRLRDLYYRAGISEYWLVDARGEKLSFEILRRGPKGYVAVRKRDGWAESAVFGRSFRLTRRDGDDGLPEFSLEVR